MSGKYAQVKDQAQYARIMELSEAAENASANHMQQVVDASLSGRGRGVISVRTCREWAKLLTLLADAQEGLREISDAEHALILERNRAGLQS